MDERPPVWIGHALLAVTDLDASPLERGRIHDSFVAHHPDGYPVTVNSSHGVGTV
jgi:hypothetical protein